MPPSKSHTPKASSKAANLWTSFKTRLHNSAKPKARETSTLLARTDTLLASLPSEPSEQEKATDALAQELRAALDEAAKTLAKGEIDLFHSRDALYSLEASGVDTREAQAGVASMEAQYADLARMIERNQRILRNHEELREIFAMRKRA